VPIEVEEIGMMGSKVPPHPEIRVLGPRRLAQLDLEKCWQMHRFYRLHVPSSLVGLFSRQLDYSQGAQK
jgi:hypothetical protein